MKRHTRCRPRRGGTHKQRQHGTCGAGGPSTAPGRPRAGAALLLVVRPSRPGLHVGCLSRPGVHGCCSEQVVACIAMPFYVESAHERGRVASSLNASARRSPCALVFGSARAAPHLETRRRTSSREGAAVGAAGGRRRPIQQPGRRGRAARPGLGHAGVGPVCGGAAAAAGERVLRVRRRAGLRRGARGGRPGRQRRQRCARPAPLRSTWSLRQSTCAWHPMRWACKRLCMMRSMCWKEYQCIHFKRTQQDHGAASQAVHTCTVTLT